MIDGVAAGAVGERLVVEGVVQGVGFRPFVSRLASELGLAGHVGNDSTSVFVEAFGPSDAIEVFASRLVTEAPPLARIDRLTRRPIEVVRARAPGFEIVGSRDAPGPRTLLPADAAACADCISELFDPADRRYRHPFITCTNCGPRFTIITAVPYDRPNTTMANFAMCSACDREYRDPSDRRYHAQPIACHDCGPQLAFTAAERGSSTPADPIAAAVAALDGGAIVAIKGLGGYHLACDATRTDVVAALRDRKRRPDKPFAVMVANIDQVRDLAHLTEPEAELLSSSAAPIVLLRARSGSSLSTMVAPHNPLVGVMLPYTPVHHLLLEARPGPLVMTSANFGGEPIVRDRADLERLEGVFEGVLDHDRPINVPCDDSVTRVVDEAVLPIRRARGYAPITVVLPGVDRSVLAVGAELKNTFCVAGGGYAWVGPHIGDMANLATLDAFSVGITQFADMYDIAPDVVAADAHPSYLSSNWARDRYRDRLLDVQHHHAHVAAVMAEHRLPPDDPVLGFAFDGTGYGRDGTIWGGEVLIATAASFERAAHLAPVPLPGGDAAVRNPARIALAHLHAAGLPWPAWLPSVEWYSPAELRLLRQQLDADVACVATTSMGRLFDAVSSLVGLRHEITYEAQAAIDLEICAQRALDEPPEDFDPDLYRFAADGALVTPRPVLEAIVEDLACGAPAGVIAARFHLAVVEVVERLAIDLRARSGIGTVVLSGGVFQNALLTRLCTERLTLGRFDVKTHRLVPPNDGGLSLGQAYVASYANLSRTNA